MAKFFSKDFDLTITAAGQTVKKTFELDKSVIAITHYTILSNREDLTYYRGSFGLDISKDEIVPDGYSVKKVMSWPSVPADVRLKSIGRRETKNGLIGFTYADTNDGLTAFQPYTVTLSVEGEREDS